MTRYFDEYFWEFRGFHGSASRVHLRLVHEEGKPFVVVCSQPTLGAGTSVQNAHEIIRDYLLPIVTKRLMGNRKKNVSKEIDSLRKSVQTSGGINSGLLVWLLGKISDRLNRETYHKYKLSQNINLVWIEHWPPGTGPEMGPPDDYLLVRENQEGELAWSRVQAAEIAKLIEYETEVVEKNNQIFENDRVRRLSRA